MDYWILKPVGARRSWSVQCRDGKKTKVVVDERIKVINELARKGSVTHDDVEKQLRLLIEEYKEKDKPEGVVTLTNSINVELVDAYWREVYEWRPIDPESKRSAKNKLHLVIKALGALDLNRASLSQLQTCVNDSTSSKKKLVIYMNSLLKYIRRSERVRLGKSSNNKIKYLSVGDFELILKHLDPVHALVATAAFATGCRVGEVFSLKTIGRKGSVWVDSQLKRDVKEHNTKNHKSRWTVIVPKYKENVEQWINYEKKESIRNLRWSDIIKRACEKAFPNNPQKHLTFHGLRHSYAVYWLTLEANPKRVAECLGDSLVVVLEYYAPYITTDEGESYMLSLVK